MPHRDLNQHPVVIRVKLPISRLHVDRSQYNKGRRRKVFAMSIRAETRTGNIQAQKKVADQLRSIIEQGRRTIEESRLLHKETETVLEESTLALLDSRHLIARISRRPAGGGPYG